MSENFYGTVSPVRAGVAGNCPRCGRGKLFSGYLSVAKACGNCGLSFDFADAGDGAAWFVMLAAGALAMGGVLFTEFNWHPAYWVHALVAVPLALIVPLLLLRPAKGVLLCQQYATHASEGRLK